MDKKPLIGVSICTVILLLITSMHCTVSADQIRNHPVTIEITGQNTQQQRTINVSDTDLQKIQQVFTDVSINLESASSPKDKRQVYWNAVCRLHDLGVFGSLSCEDAYRLATRWYRPSTSLSKFQPLKDSNNTNTFCLVTSRVNYSTPTNRISNYLNFLSDYIFYHGLESNPNINKFWLSIFILGIWITSVFITMGLATLIQRIVEISPIAIGNLVGIGVYGYSAQAGWIKTDGRLGTKNWDGNLYGALPGYVHDWPIYFYQAMWGFCRIKIQYENTWNGYDASYLGSALIVGINETG